MSGYLLQDTMTEAFSRDTLSAGRPSVFHLAWSASLASTLRGSTPSVKGIFLVIMSGIQVSFHKVYLKVKEKGPI